MPAIRTILHPTDFSENSRYAFQTACSLARENDARLVLLHVIYPSSAPILDEPPIDPSKPVEAQALKAAFSWPQPSDPKLIVEHRAAEGDAPDEILRLAKALQCDLIVMGTHGRTGLSRLLTGSVAEEVLRKAGCPVLAVKTPLAETPPAEPEAQAMPGEIVDVRPLGAKLTAAKTRKLVGADGLEIVRLIVPAGKEIAPHRVKGTLVVNCLEGRVAFTAMGKTQNIQNGELLYLPAGELHSVKGVEDASLLITIIERK